MIRFAVFLGLVLWAAPAFAVDLNLPTAARLLVERNTSPDRYHAPLAAYSENALPTQMFEGDIARATWRLDATGMTALQVLRPLRDQLEAAGFRIVLDCISSVCGGFDFRFATEVLPAPNMFVNINAFQFITALRGAADAPTEVVTVLASTTAASAYIQIIQAGGAKKKVVATGEPPVPHVKVVPGNLAEALIGQGHAVLDGLDFETGTSDLGQGKFPSLEQLATIMAARPTLRIALVGHTDTVGGLNTNIALSRRRAQSVRQRLISEHGIAGGRMEADGMGYLSPVASNLDEVGREANRRVEVVLLSE